MSSFIEIDYSELTRLSKLWHVAPDWAREEMAITMTEVDAFLLREVQEATPVGASRGGASGLKGSMFHTEEINEDSVIGLVASSLAYAEPVELGTRPHFPPIDPLVDWVIAVLDVPEAEARSVAFLVARKIARKGTDPALMFTKTWERNEAAVQAMFQAGCDRLAARIEAGY